MKVKAIKTRLLIPPQDDLLSAIKESVTKLKEETVICIATKVVSINEGRCVLISEVEDKDGLIIEESNLYLSRDQTPNRWVMHTITNNILLPSAGIDASNADGHYILWPKDPDKSAKKLWGDLKKMYGVKKLGIVLADSHSIPLRRGLVGLCLAYFGFNPLRDYRGKKDLFGRKMEISQSNLPDSIAAAAVLETGEGDEQSPIALVSNVRDIVFSNIEYRSNKPYSSYEVTMKEDLFRPILESVPWQKGGKGSQ